MIFDKLKKAVHYTYFHPRYIANRELIKIISLEGPMLHGKLLDVGCGIKPYAYLLPNTETYIGLEISSTMHGLSQVDIIGTSLALPFKDECFDSILCTEVLEHTSDPLMSLCEMWRVTKAEEVLLLTVPLSEQLHEEPNDYYRFTKYGLNYLLRQSGWRILKVYERGGTWLELGYRLSSFLYSSFSSKRKTDGRLNIYIFLRPLIIILCSGLQFIATALDTVWRSRLSTIGYGVLAKKKSLK
jgi:SAM-dependent methyltransferase